MWISGPPGAGKTSLVSSYLSRHRARSLWYQIDPGDNDPATFFHYLAVAVHAMNPRSRCRLPTLRPEYFQSLPVFSRRFFETLSSARFPPRILILDSYHDLPDGSPMHELLREGIEVIGHRTGLIVCSRGDPPEAFARMRVNRHISLIDNTKLALTSTEARSVARIRGLALSPGEIEQMLSETGGWAAGVTLLMEDRAISARCGWRPGGNAQVLFDYFAREVFAKMDTGVREILLATSCLTEVSAEVALRLTKNHRAHAVLSDLARRNYFTSVHGRNDTYRYHTLFRAFLQSQAHNTLAADQLNAIRATAATLLVETGEIEAAALLLADMRDWPALANLCVEAAARLLAQGRAQTLVSWAMMLPETVREQSPWVLYWLATAQQPFGTARSMFEKSFALFREQNDALGQFLSWAGIAHCYLLVWDEFTSSDRWILEFEELRHRYPVFPASDVERHVVSGILALLTFRKPYHRDIAYWADRLSMLITQTDQAEEQIRIAGPLLTYLLWIGDLGDAGLLIDSLHRAIRARDVAAPERMVLMLLEAAYLWHIEKPERCLSVVDEALALGASNGFHGLDGRIRAQALYAYLGQGELSSCPAILEAAKPNLDARRRLDLSHYHYQAACFHRLDGNLALAESHGRRALALANEAGAVFPRGLCHTSMGLILIDRCEYPSAAAHIRAAYRIGHAMGSTLLLFMALVADAWTALSSANEKHACQRLREGFSLGAKHHYVSPWEGWSRNMMTRLCQVALEHGIEIDYTLFLIRSARVIQRQCGACAENSCAAARVQ